MTRDESALDDRRIPAVALLLGAGGLIPFVAGAALPAFEIQALAPWEGIIRGALTAYAGLIASFLGGVRWGLGLRDADPDRSAILLIGSVIPSLVAWTAMILPPPHDLTLLIALFLVLGIADVRLVARGEAPRWFGTLRLGLTVGVVGSLVLALALGR